MYNEQMVAPMRGELSSNGVEELKSKEEVNNFVDNLKNKKIRSAVIFINSVCGCAAGTARPSFLASLAHEKKAIKNATVFAGVDNEGTAAVREYLPGIAHSSPSIVFFREGNLVHFIGRSEIDGASVELLQQYIHSAYEKFFGEEIDVHAKLSSPQEVIKVEGKEITAVLENGGMNGDKKYLFYDCRSPEEREENMQALPKNELQKNLLQQSNLLTQESAEELVAMGSKLQNTKVVFFSNAGTRSVQAVMYFQKHGFEGFRSLHGGIAGL